MAYLKNWTDNFFQIFSMGTSWVAISINNITTRPSREMTSRKNIKIFDYNGVNVAKHWHVADEVFAISDCLVIEGCTCTCPQICGTKFPSPPFWQNIPTSVKLNSPLSFPPLITSKIIIHFWRNIPSPTVFAAQVPKPTSPYTWQTPLIITNWVDRKGWVPVYNNIYIYIYMYSQAWRACTSPSPQSQWWQ